MPTPEPTPEPEPVAEPTAAAVATPAPAPAAPAPAPAPAPTKEQPKKAAAATPPPAPPIKTPEKKVTENVAKAAPAPAKKSTKTPPPTKKTTTKKPAQPRTRAEKVAVLLDAAAENMRADRLTKPKKQNALSDYLTVLAIEKDNDTAHRGVEKIVERYVVMAGQATGAAQFDKANGYLKQARFVLDAMKLRKWPKERYDPLFQEYREAGRVLAAAR